MLLNREMSLWIIFRDVLVSAEGNLLYLVPFSFADLIEKRNFLRLPLNHCIHAYIEVALSLKIINEIAFSLVYQILIDGAFLIHRQQFLLVSLAEKGNPRQARSGCADAHSWPFIHVNIEVGTVRAGIILRRSELYSACQMIAF